MTSGDPACAAARAIAAAVRAVPGVIDLSGGPGEATATYGPGERVTGVLLVQVADGWQGCARLCVAASAIREAALAAQSAAVEAAAGEGLRLDRFDVYIDDVLTEPSRR